MKRFYYIDENNQEVLDQDAVSEAINEGSFKSVIGWWSGGITSAVTCKMIIDLYGIDNCRFIFIDTKNEDDDTYRFMKDCEKWYGKEIETISAIGSEYDSIQDVWTKHKSLNVANGAICSYKLKRVVREKWQKTNAYSAQAFGFELDEAKRARGMVMNHKKARPIFPLLLEGLTKKDCIEIVEQANIDIPNVYKYGFLNNNCFKTGCVQGGIGYWQKIAREYPEKLDAMSKVEVDLTELKGSPVTMLKDQSKDGGLVFLKHNPSYPEVKDISMMKGREPQPLFECNGFCGTNDLDERKDSEQEINFQMDIFDIGA